MVHVDLMGWKKPADPVNVSFHVRTTRGERAALDAIITRWAERQNVSASGITSNAWFRNLVRRLAAEDGISIFEAKGPELKKGSKAKRVLRKAS